MRVVLGIPADFLLFAAPLLVGFALHPRRFQESRMPAVLLRDRPGDWKEGQALLLAVTLGCARARGAGESLGLVTPGLIAGN